MFHIGFEHLSILLAAFLVLGDPLTREFAVLDFLQNLLHFFLRATIHDARAASEIAVLRRIGNVLVHFGESAFVQQVHDQLQLMQAFVVRDFRLIAGFDQRLPALHNQLGRAAAEHGLFAEEIGFRLLCEGGFEDAAASAADAVRIGQRILVRVARGVLRHRDQCGYAAAVLELTAHQAAGAFRCNQDHIEILARTNLFEMNVEAVCEQQRRAFRNIGRHLFIELLLRQIGDHHCDELRAFHGLRGFRDFQAVFLGSVPTRAVLTHAHHHI
jgi:hypothetical protein